MNIFQIYIGYYAVNYADLLISPNLKKTLTLHKKWSFPLRISSVNVTKSAQKTADLVTFTGEILNGKLHFLCSVTWTRFKLCIGTVWTIYFDCRINFKDLSKFGIILDSPFNPSSKSRMETLEQWLESVQIQQQLHQNDFVNFEEKSYIVLLFSLLNKSLPTRCG